MTTRYHCGRRAVVCVLVAIAAATVSVAGRPQQMFTQDDYARAVFAQYYPSAGPLNMIQLNPTEPAEQSSFRSSRSDDRKTNKSPPLVGHSNGAQPQNYGVDVQAEVAAVTVPCKAIVADQSQGNDTTSVNTVEKLEAFYKQLKTQQEALAFQQFQQQLYEQQHRRHQEFELMQRQIQHQYLQQQQHAMLLLDQMRKNPAFVSQMASFVDQKINSMAHNETSGTKALTVAVPEVTANVEIKKPPTPQEKDKTIGNHMVVEHDNDSDDPGHKRLDARQVTRQKVISSDRKQRPMTYDEDNDNDEDDTSIQYEDE